MMLVHHLANKRGRITCGVRGLDPQRTSLKRESVTCNNCRRMLGLAMIGHSKKRKALERGLDDLLSTNIDETPYAALVKPIGNTDPEEQSMKRIEELEQEVSDLEEVLEDKRRLTRELDIALHGEKAAPQASLCDLIEPARRLRESVVTPELQRVYAAFYATERAEAAYLLYTRHGRAIARDPDNLTGATAIDYKNARPATRADDELRRMFRLAGGEFHGPNVETATIPESLLLPLLRLLLRL